MRHKLQKGLVTHGSTPKDEDMETMNEHLTALESHQDLEAKIISNTKVHKLLKVILKATNIPREAEFKFKERCEKLLRAWTLTLHKAEEAASAPAPETNGTKNGSIEAKDTTPAVVPSIEGKADAKDSEPKITNGETEAKLAEEKPVDSVTEQEKVEV
jgi:hypothetical protein